MDPVCGRIRRALLKRYPAAGEAELREFSAAAGRFGQITGGAMFLQGYTLARIPPELLPALTGERNVYRCAGAIYSALVTQPGGRERFLFLCELQGARVECLQELARMQEGDGTSGWSAAGRRGRSVAGGPFAHASAAIYPCGPDDV